MSHTPVRELGMFLKWYKESAPCTDCGLAFAACQLDLDHVPERGEKVACVVEFVKVGDQQGLWNELAKCDVVCSNCHRLRTKKRGPSAVSIRKSATTRTGKPHTLRKAVRKLITAKLKGKSPSLDTRKKLSEVATGRTHSQQWKDNISDGLRNSSKLRESAKAAWAPGGAQRLSRLEGRGRR